MKLRTLALAMTVAIVGFSSCEKDDDETPNEQPENNGSGSTENSEDYTFSGTISQNTTWKDRGVDVDYVINGSLNIQGNALLTIEPGVTVMFASKDGALYVGENAGLRMVGKADSTINFVGPTNNQNVGSWKTIQINSKRTDNVWEYVNFKNGGSDDYQWGGVVDIQDAKVSMKHCTVDGALGVGISIEGSSELLAFDNNTIKNCGTFPVNSESLSAVLPITIGNKFLSNGNNAVQIVNGTLEASANKTFTLNKLTIPYQAKGNLNVKGNAILNVQPGVTIQFAEADNGVYVDENAGLKMVGLADTVITLTGLVDNPGAWSGVTMNSKRADNAWEYVVFKNGGSDDYQWHAVLDIQSAKLSIKNCTVDGSLGMGIDLEGSVSLSAFEGNTVKNCAAFPIIVEEAEVALQLTLNNTYESNGDNMVNVTGNNIAPASNKSYTLNKLSIPYYFSEGLDLRETQTFTIEAGTQIRMAADKGIGVDENVTLVAEGTETEPIVIAANDEGKSFWDGIKYHSKKSASKMSYCNISGGGDSSSDGFYAAMLMIWNNSQLTISNCSFSNTEKYAVAIENTSECVIKSSGVTFANCDGGNVFIESTGEVKEVMP